MLWLGRRAFEALPPPSPPPAPPRPFLKPGKGQNGSIPSFPPPSAQRTRATVCQGSLWGKSGPAQSPRRKGAPKADLMGQWPAREQLQSGEALLTGKTLETVWEKHDLTGDCTLEYGRSTHPCNRRKLSLDRDGSFLTGVYCILPNQSELSQPFNLEAIACCCRNPLPSFLRCISSWSSEA